MNRAELLSEKHGGQDISLLIMRLLHTCPGVVNVARLLDLEDKPSPSVLPDWRKSSTFSKRGGAKSTSKGIAKET